MQKNVLVIIILETLAEHGAVLIRMDITAYSCTGFIIAPFLQFHRVN